MPRVYEASAVCIALLAQELSVQLLVIAADGV
jgi:hypothetical protein